MYSFIRRRGYGRQDAQDLTQDFFIHLVEKNAFRREDPNRGKFRTFLLGSLEFFLQHASQRARAEKRGGQANVKLYRDPVHRPAPPEIGRALHVNYLVSGSIQREANQIRASVHIIEAKTGRELWAEHYDGEPADVFAIQTQIAEVISQELRAKLSSAEKATIEEVPTHDVAAYELYLHARELLWNYDEATQGWDPLFSAVRLLEEAVNRDPNFALAWLQLATMHDALYWFNADRSDGSRHAAEIALQKALSLRPDLGENHLRLASHLLTTTRDYPATADRDFTKAEKILAADPKQEFEAGSRKFVCKDYLLGSIKAEEQDDTAAKIAFARARPLQLAYVDKWPDDPDPLMVLASTDAALGRKEDALREGRQAAAMRTISQDAVEGPILARDLAGVYLLAGEKELAIEQLESLAQVPRALYYGDLAKLPDWDPLRNDPRFQKLLSDLKPIPIVNHLELGKN